MLWDVEGRRYIDFVGGIGSLNAGHANPRVVAAIAEQAARSRIRVFKSRCTSRTFASPKNSIVARRALRRRKTLLLSTGAEATENAVKIAREYTRRPAIIAFTHGYHGRTLLALSMTGKDEPTSSISDRSAAKSTTRHSHTNTTE